MILESADRMHKIVAEYDEACINCRVGFPNHYEGVEES